MKKIFPLLFSIILVFCSAVIVFAQEIEEEIPLNRRFPLTKISDSMSQYAPATYYRFSPDVLFFDQIDLSYFPHELWKKDIWTLLGRWDDGKTYSQMIYSDTPAAKKLMHGKDVGESRGFLRDFYLYATLFIYDNYPENSGSCYIYYSDSLLIGYKESKGILIDPESGIYQAVNSYGGSRHATYSQNSIKHDLELVKEIDPLDFTFDRENIASSSVGSSAYPNVNLETQFLQDLESITGKYRMAASPSVKAYRVEVIRENGISDIYINGKNVISFRDNITTSDAAGKPVPDRVSWSYGPILNEGGMTVTCSIGDLYIYGTGLNEVL